MVIAIIVIACLLAAGLVALFVTVQVMWHRAYPKTLPDGTPKPRQSAKEWFKNHIPSKRRLIQVYAALLYNANIKGFISGDIYQSKTTKYMCVPGLNCYSCPGAVGACPLGAFQNALAETKTSAPYYVLGILALFGLMFARTICGFLCPVGLGQDLLYKIRTPKLKKSRVTRVLSYLKYVILALLAIAIPLVYVFQDIPLPGFCKYICPAGTLGGAVMLLLNPSNAGMYDNLGPLFTWKFCVLVAIIVAAIFIYRVFCRFLCPLGAIYGFFNRIALVGVKLDKENCTDCGLCVSHCKMDVKRVGDHECINCGECIAVCPTKAIRWKGSKLFVHANAVPPPAEERPIAAMASGSAEAVTEPAEMPVSAPESLQEEAATAELATKAVKRPTKRGKRFWLELAAWIAALGLLVGALVYYNFVDVEKKVGYKVGKIAPDFTLQLYGTDETFKLYEKKDEVTIVTFWTTESDSYENTLTYFNELSENYADWNVIAICRQDDAAAISYIDEHCSGWSLRFAKDNVKRSVYSTLGGEGAWNQTVIVSKEGKIAYNSTTVFESYAALRKAAIVAMSTGYHVGEIAPDFTLELIGAEGTYNLYEHRGKVTIINFWATWCTPCKAELPYFNELTEKHPEWNVVAIHGTLAGGSPSKYIADNCSDWKLTFVQDIIEDINCKTFISLGGTSMWPMTIMLDEEGIVIYNSTASFHNYEQLESTVQASILAAKG